jgi:hypothetical protein
MVMYKILKAKSTSTEGFWSVELNDSVVQKYWREGWQRYLYHFTMVDYYRSDFVEVFYLTDLVIFRKSSSKEGPEVAGAYPIIKR